MNGESRLRVKCCPDLLEDRACDVLDFHYRMIHFVTVDDADRGRRVAVEVLIHARLERCTEGFALGDLAYSTTLLPGERVRLFSADRRTRFSFDTETSLSYRHEQTSEEHYYMSSMSDFMSDVTVRDRGSASSSHRGSSERHGETSGFLETLFAGPSVDVSGSHNAESTSEFMRELTQHAEASHHRSVEATRTANSVSVGEVQTRSHAEGESEDHFEAASRAFSNPNRCRAVTFFFYQINKVQTIRFTIEAIQRRVIDPAADAKVTNNEFTSRGDIAVIPQAVLATKANRLDVERIGRQSVAEQAREAVGASGSPARGVGAGAAFAVSAPLIAERERQPMSAAVRRQALAQVDADLGKQGLVSHAGGTITDEARRRFSFERRTSLPTPGLLVRGCLDDCNICEPAVQQEIELDLERKRLENLLLKKQIDLLEESQEYRCCPVGSAEDTPAGGGNGGP